MDLEIFCGPRKRLYLNQIHKQSKKLKGFFMHLKSSSRLVGRQDDNARPKRIRNNSQRRTLLYGLYFNIHSQMTDNFQLD